MKQKYDINEIKRFLEAYYDGNTSIEQEKLLCDFFASATEIPAEMEADRQLFNSLHSVLAKEIIVPDNLENQLISHIDNLEKAEQINRRKWIKPFAYISAAACAILLFTFGIKIFNPENNQINQTAKTVLISETKVFDSINSNSNPIQEIEAPEPIKTEDITLPKAETKKKKVKRQRIVKQNDLKSVSDEQIAYENTEHALLLLSEKLNKAQKGIDKTESTINEINNTFKNATL